MVHDQRSFLAVPSTDAGGGRQFMQLWRSYASILFFACSEERHLMDGNAGAEGNTVVD